MIKYYTLKEEYGVTVLTRQDSVMVILCAGHRIKIENNNVFAMGLDGKWHKTIDYPNSIMPYLELDEN
jgi:hypothetical protein